MSTHHQGSISVYGEHGEILATKVAPFEMTPKGFAPASVVRFGVNRFACGPCDVYGYTMTCEGEVTNHRFSTTKPWRIHEGANIEIIPRKDWKG